jgi:hypothetical protein
MGADTGAVVVIADADNTDFITDVIRQFFRIEPADRF